MKGGKMKKPLTTEALDQLFLDAHTMYRFTDRPVSEETIRHLYEVMKFGPTAANCQPGRYVFLKSKEAKERLFPCLAPDNVVKAQSAAVTVIVAMDSRFYDYLPSLWKLYDARQPYIDNPAEAKTSALRNGTLNGAYLIMAARALGLDCGPMTGFDNAKLDAEFFPDGRYISNFLVNMGYGAEGGSNPRGPRLDFDEVAKIL